MFAWETNDTVIVEQKQALEAALSTNPKIQNKLRAIIRRCIKQARAQVVDNIHFANGDPRDAARSVRTSVYKKILGANINIYSSRRAHGSNNYEPPRTLRVGQRGGNRMPRSAETKRIMSYGPLDRGFVLRFVNSGVGERNTRFGSRGNIGARNFFNMAASAALSRAEDNISQMIDEELEKMVNTQ